jgi:hypothetical protein
MKIPNQHPLLFLFEVSVYSQFCKAYNDFNPKDEVHFCAEFIQLSKVEFRAPFIPPWALLSVHVPVLPYFAHRNRGAQLPSRSS